MLKLLKTLIILIRSSNQSMEFEEDKSRIHITAIGYDANRITDPIIKRNADKAYFLVHNGKNLELKEHLEFARKKLKEQNIPIVEDKINIFDFYSCIESYRKIIQKELNNHISINISTGSKITAIAGMLSSMLWPNVKPYYVHVEYTKERKKFVETKCDTSYNLPVYDIKKPQSEYLEVIKILSNIKKDITKKQLIGELRKKQIIKPKDDNRTLSVYAEHSQLRSILEPMEKQWGFIKINKDGARAIVSLTDQGRKAIQIFGKENTR